ncbi:MAG: L-ribulose-5-phosphate 4-epimerase AraD [Bacteroidia bacterium]
MANPAYQQIREAAYAANCELPRLGLVLFTFGNVSVADHRLGVFAIKASGVPYEALTPEKMVIVNFDGQTVEGALRPSSDTLTHAVLYKHWPDVNSIVHTHSTHATAWAQAQMDVPILGTTHADHLTIDVPCAPVMNDAMIEGDYELQTGHQILDCFAERQIDYHEVEMVLIANHGPFCWGQSAQTALYNSAVLEEISKMAWMTRQINPNAARLKDSLIRKHYERKHGKNAYYGQE